MNDRGIWIEGEQSSSQQNIHGSTEKILSDIILFCKNPKLYCEDKCILPPQTENSDSYTIPEEERDLASSVFQNADRQILEIPDPVTGLTSIHYAAYFGLYNC